MGILFSSTYVFVSKLLFFYLILYMLIIIVIITVIVCFFINIIFSIYFLPFTCVSLFLDNSVDND